MMQETVNKQELIKRVEILFAEKSWNYNYDETYCKFSINFSLGCKLKETCAFITCMDEGIYYSFSINIGTDDENEQQVMEFVTRANSNMWHGCFEMDVDNNSLCYRTFLICKDLPSGEAIESGIASGIRTLERYGDELLAVIFGMKSAKDAFEALFRKQ